MAVFSLKFRDTRPILEVALKNPDGSAHDLTGSSAWNLHIVVDGRLVTRTMVLEGAPTLGVLRYTWLAGDWSDVDGLPTVAAQQRKDLAMEYEVVGGSSRLTFPNDGQDTLRITGDLGQA